MITRQTIINEDSVFEVCEYTNIVIETLYDKTAKEKLSRIAFLETLPHALKVSALLLRMLVPDSLDEYVRQITLEQTSLTDSVWYQKNSIEALKTINRNDVAVCMQQAIDEYLKNKEITKETESVLFAFQTHDTDPGSIYDSFAQYIKQHVEEIVTQEYIEKAQHVISEPAQNTETYKKKIKDQYSWFKM